MPLWFDPPVRVASAQPGVTINVTTVERAAELLHEWRDLFEDKSRSWRVAVRACVAAFDGEGSAAAARVAFIEAAEAAGLLLEK